MEPFTKGIDKTIPVPLYYQLKLSIKADIDNGRLKVGDSIPTENEIASYYNLSRSTVRQAILDLTNEGLLTRKASKGTFVTDPPKSPGIIRSYEPFNQQIKKTGKTPRTELLSLKVIVPTEDIAKKMDLGKDEQVISLFRRRFADDMPTMTIHNYIPYRLCSFILSYDFTNNSLYEILMSRENTRISRTRSIVSSEAATSEDKKLLNVEPGAPMLCFNNIAKNSDGVIIDFAYARYRGDSNKFEVIESPTERKVM